MEITGLHPLIVNGLPLHPLIVHAVVVFVPLGALSAIGFALVPRWRWLLRWPTLLIALAAVVLTRIAVLSGTRLKTDRKLGGDLIAPPLEELHRSFDLLNPHRLNLRHRPVPLPSSPVLCFPRSTP